MFFDIYGIGMFFKCIYLYKYIYNIYLYIDMVRRLCIKSFIIRKYMYGLMKAKYGC